jgi:hypothetical protein
MVASVAQGMGTMKECAWLARPTQPVEGYSSSGRWRRSRLVADRRRLASSRAAFAARLGRVRFRGLGIRRASATIRTRRSVTSSRLRS